MNLAEKIRGAIANAELVEDVDEPLTVSIGVSCFDGDERAFFDQADRALYRAKNEGRDCVIVAEECEQA